MKRFFILILAIVFLFLFSIPLFGIPADTYSISDARWQTPSPRSVDGFWVLEWYDRLSGEFGEMLWEDGNVKNFYAPYEAADLSDPRWYCRTLPSGKSLHPASFTDAVLSFVCPRAGTISLEISANRSSEVKEGNNGSTLTLWKNNQVAVAEQKVEDTAPVKISHSLEVLAGDRIRLAVGSQGNLPGDRTSITQFDVQYTKEADPVPVDPVLPEKDYYLYSDEGWGKGSPYSPDGLWTYEWYDETTGKFSIMKWDSSLASPGFAAPYTQTNVEDPLWFCYLQSEGMSLYPGKTAQPVKTFRCPRAGTVRMVVAGSRYYPSGDGNGVSLTVMRNETVVPVDGEEQKILTDDQPFVLIAETEVAEGDLLRLMAGSMGDIFHDRVMLTMHAVSYGEEISSDLVEILPETEKNTSSSETTDFTGIKNFPTDFSDDLGNEDSSGSEIPFGRKDPSVSSDSFEERLPLAGVGTPIPEEPAPESSAVWGLSRALIVLFSLAACVLFWLR